MQLQALQCTRTIKCQLQPKKKRQIHAWQVAFKCWKVELSELIMIRGVDKI